MPWSNSTFPAMTRWRVQRAQEVKEKYYGKRATMTDETSVQAYYALVKSYAVEVLVPCLVNDFPLCRR